MLGTEASVLRRKLEGYLGEDANFKRVFEFTKKRFIAAKNLTAHNWEHTYRDTLNAIVIGEAEQADMAVVLPAIVMHDIGFLYGATGKTHAAVGAEKLADYLTEAGADYSADLIKKIQDCIRTHKGSMHNETPESLEAKVVADADLQEKFGPFGIYQFIRAHTEFNESLEQILERETAIQKLRLETETGKRLAEPGRQFVADFLKNLREANHAYETE